MIATALTTALVDYVPIAHIVNQRIVKSMPVGKYHERHNVDGDPTYDADRILRLH